VDNETWLKLVEKYGEGRVAAVESKPEIAFCKPTRAEYDRWFDAQNADKKNQTKYARELEQDCVVYPGNGKGDPQGHEAFKAALDNNPSLCMCEFLDAVTGLAGLSDRANIRK
jgi:hypothetical protein